MSLELNLFEFFTEGIPYVALAAESDINRDYVSSQMKLLAITAGHFALCGMRSTRL